MTYRTLLVEAEPEGFADDRIKCAAALAKRFSARLIGLGAEIAPLRRTPSPKDDSSAVYDARIKDDFAASKANFDRLTEGLNTEWRERRVLPGRAMYEAARRADLIIAGGAKRPDSLIYRAAEPGALAVQCGRPVLVAPLGAQAPRAKRIVVAWKDSPETRRAVSDALPFLSGADQVVVLRLCSPKDQEALTGVVEDVAAYLRSHGVNASGLTRERADMSVGEDLLENAKTEGADLIVAGAYGRNRLDDWAFGGVTRALLGQTETAILLSR